MIFNINFSFSAGGQIMLRWTDDGCRRLLRVRRRDALERSGLLNLLSNPIRQLTILALVLLWPSNFALSQTTAVPSRAKPANQSSQSEVDRLRSEVERLRTELEQLRSFVQARAKVQETDRASSPTNAQTSGESRKT